MLKECTYVTQMFVFVVIGSEAWMFIYIDIYAVLLLFYHILGYILHVNVLVFNVTNNFSHFA